RATDHHPRFLLAALKPGQQLFGQTDAAVPQQDLALASPGTVGNRCSSQVDYCIHGLFTEIVEMRNTPHRIAAQTRDFSGAPTPDGELMTLFLPESAELTS